MLLIGLTGSLATGKSSVSAILSQPPHSLPIIDADLLARRVVEPGTFGYNRIVAHFGPSTPDLLLPPPPPPPISTSSSAENQEQDRDAAAIAKKKNGKATKLEGRPIDRAVLGRRVFGTTPSRHRDRKALNAIVHPLVRLEMFLAVLRYYVRGHRAVVLDIPLLYESGLDVFCGVVVMVAVSDPAVQMRRLRERDPGLSEGEAGERVGSQMGVGEKVGRTRVRGRGGGRGKVVWNDGGKEELAGGVEGVVGEILGGRGRWWDWWLWGSPVVALGVGVWEVWRGWRDRRRWEEERARL